MLKFQSLVWKRTSFPCPFKLSRAFRVACFSQTKGSMYHAMIAFMYAVVQGDIQLDVCEAAKNRPGVLLADIADDEDDLDAFKIRTKKGGVTLNSTEYVKDFFY